MSKKNRNYPSEPVKHSKVIERTTPYVIGGAIVIFFLTLIIYLPALKNDFVWDDIQYVSKNTMIRSFDLHSLYKMLTSFYQANWHPLTWFSHAVDYAFWGLNPPGHRLTNVILHGFNAVLVFLLIVRLMLRAQEVNKMTSADKLPLPVWMNSLTVAGITALLFAIHPVHVESVAWVAERKDVLCAFFFLLTLICYLSYTSPSAKRNRWMWFTMCLFLFLLALMSKPMAVTLPLSLLLLDIYPLKRLKPGLNKNLSPLLEKIPFFVLSGASSFLTIMAQSSGGAVKSFEHLPASFPVLNALNSLMFYMGKMIWPFELVPFYPFPKDVFPLAPHYLVSAVLVIAVTGLCLWMIRQGKYLLFTVWSYYVVTLLPVLGIIQVGGQAAADRYTYLPSISIFLLIGLSVVWGWEKISLVRFKVWFRAMFLVSLSMIVFLLGYLTISQIKVWQNPEMFWSYIIKVFPETFAEAYSSLGVAYYKKGMMDEAIIEHRKALDIKPRYEKAYLNLGAAYSRKDELDEAIAAYRKALDIKPDYAEARTNLGLAYAKKGMIDEAISEHKKAIANNQDFAEAHYNLALAYSRKGMVNKSIYEYEKAVAINPYYVEAHTNLGRMYSKKGMLDEAVAEYKKAIAINSYYSTAHNNLGLVYVKKGMLDEAISEYQKVVTINPGSAGANNNLGRAYAKKGLLDEAISAYEQALSIKPRYAEVLYNLGIANAKKGFFGEAISAYKQALTVKPRYVEAHVNLGAAYAAKGSLDEAISAYKKALALNGKFIKAYNNLGIVYYKMGRLDKAISQYKKALAVKPDYVNALCNLGFAYAEKGRLNEAIIAFEKALTIKPNLAKVHGELASVYYSTKDYKLAVVHCDRARALGSKISPQLLEKLEPYRKK